MINDVTSIKGYDQTAYEIAEKLYTETTGKTSEDFANRVLELGQNEFLDFSDVMRQIGHELPVLENPVTKPNYAEMTLIPTLSAASMALITDISNENRKAINEARIEETKILVEKMHEEADKMRTKAIVQLVLGIVSGTLQIAGGLYAAGASGKALKNTDLSGAQLMAKNSSIQGINGAVGGLKSLVDAGSQFGGTIIDAQITDIKATEEQARAQRQQLESLDEALKALIAKMVQTESNIEQSSREARNKILA